ncbi:ankyrin repeat domain-containing protein [Derxia lacustris]|uniref:ankyrin repeat domain-containing protein n=1 Tax=Derxia lacustris TaxID=764842 RepID=UPI000A176B80|nr:ankyrin repeat domain-containing protein [Derxia lacustris]
MPAIAPPEILLLAFSRQLGSDFARSETRLDDFLRRELAPEKSRAILDRLLHSILADLELDSPAADSAIAVAQLAELTEQYAALENYVATGSAGPAQILWQLASHLLAPQLGRWLGLWALRAQSDPSLPDGYLQYLPTADLGADPPHLSLPLDSRLDWLDQALDGGLARQFGSADAFAGWRNGAIPDAAAIRAQFTDDLELQFKPQFGATPAQLRRHLLIARAVQSVYLSLGAALHGPAFDPLDADGRRNKALQLFDLARLAANLTLVAARDADSVEAQDQAFEALIPPHLRSGAFLAVLPSQARQLARLLPRLLEHQLGEATADSPLDDLFAYTPYELARLTRAALDRLAGLAARDRLADATRASLQRKPHWNRVAQIGDYDLLRSLAREKPLALSLRQMLLRRLQQLADTPRRQFDTIALELEQLLDGEDRRARPDDAADKVAQLLERARAHSLADEFAPQIHYFAALHAIAGGDLAEANRQFDAALQATRQHGIGQLRPLIANDAFATLVANPQEAGLSIDRHVRRFEQLRHFGLFRNTAPEELPGFQQYVAEAADYFHADLAWPYAGPARRRADALPSWRKHYEAVLELVLGGNQAGLQRWLDKQHALHDRGLRDVHGDSFLLHLLKQRSTLAAGLAAGSRSGRLAPAQEKALRDFLAHWPASIGTLIARWPKLVNLADFRQQTPLMLAADDGDLATVQALLAAGAGALARDHLGRSALFAAIHARSADCVRVLLDHAPELARLSAHDDASPLHAAVRVGAPAIAAALLQAAPELEGAVDSTGRTPAVLLRELLQPELAASHARYMQANRRAVGDGAEFEALAGLLLGGVALAAD